MFTGLIEGVGRVRKVRRRGEGLALELVPPPEMNDCQVGDSLSVDGVCLTVTARQGNALTMDVSAETLSRSTVGRLKPGNEVNLERALRLSDRLGGHLVTGHVEAIGKIEEKVPRGESWFLRISIPEELSKYTVQKGSVAVDGISLTVNRCGRAFLEVNIIPQTGRQTTILKKKVGDFVNLETDMIGKYVENLLREGSEGRKPDSLSIGVDREMLSRYGFGE